MRAPGSSPRGLQSRVFSAGEAIFSEGDWSDVLYLVTEGSVEITTEAGSRQLIEAGEVFGEMVLLGEERRAESARAVGAVELLPLDQRRLLSMFQTTPAFAVRVMTRLAERLRSKA